MLRLIRPTLKYKDSYLRVMKMLKESGSADFDGSLDVAKMVTDWQKAASFPDDALAYSHFWLMNDDQYIGAFGFGHSLLNSFADAANWRIQDPEFKKIELMDRLLLVKGLEKINDAILDRFSPI